MSCSRPWFDDSIVDFNGNKIPIPCGSCLSCRLDIQKMAIDRMWCAYSSHPVSAFVTFTYDDNHLIIKDGFKQPTLSKDDAHKYLDKIRHYDLPPFEYYMAGEYGDKFNRPHYHCLFFGLDYQLHKSFFESSWKKGSVMVLPCDPKSFRYVAKYITQPQSQDYIDAQFYDFGLIPPFQKYSRALGLSVYLSHLEEIQEQGFFFHRGRRISVNRYYFNKLCSYNDRLILKRSQSLDDNERRLSREAAYFNLPLDIYRNLKIFNKEQQLSAKMLNKSSHF